MSLRAVHGIRARKTQGGPSGDDLLPAASLRSRPPFSMIGLAKPIGSRPLPIVTPTHLAYTAVCLRRKQNTPIERK